jgi:forkhead transcription factor HCM1
MPLKPIINLHNKRHVNIEPPNSTPPAPSPSKPFQFPSPPLPNHPEFTTVSIPPPQNNPAYTDSLVKDHSVPPTNARPYVPPTAHRPLFTTFPSAPSHLHDKENDRHHLIPSCNENFAEFPDPSYQRSNPLKRSLSDVSNLDRPFKAMRHQEETFHPLPEPKDMPVLEDEGTKPSHSYANLIGMAILRSPNRRLTLAQIYKWIADSFSFYRNCEIGWQNSIRHNLSLNKAFQKQERPKGDSGKGNYWTIAPGMEMQFAKEKTTRKGTAVANLSVQPQPIRHHAPNPLADALAPQTWLGPPQPQLQSYPQQQQDFHPARPQTAKPQTAKPQTTRPQTARPKSAPKSIFQPAPLLPELSSDATLPASDPVPQEGGRHDNGRESHPPSSRLPQSSPPQAMNSSPPMPAPPRRRRETISPGQIAQPSSGRDRKRKAPMDDSGYFSSLESSVLRPNKSMTVFTSEMDPERSEPQEPQPKKRRATSTKRGRAEEEIARIRGSSHDITPSHLRFKSLGSDELMISSPLRGISDFGVMPTTPAMVFKKPMRQPPSISPNTHLRIHRQSVQALVNSPSRNGGPGLADESLAWSPYFKLSSLGSDLYADLGTAPSTPAMGSPFRGSIKRPAFNRIMSTPSHPLQDISAMLSTNVRANAKTPSQDTLSKPSVRFTPASPSKTVDALLLPEPDEFFDFGNYDEDDLDGLNCDVDILQGFRKIGGVVPPPMLSLSPTVQASTRNRTSRGSASQ